MSKKLVAGLIGWLILVFMLSSSVWAAANKDKTPAKKQTPAVNAANISGQAMLESLKKKLYPRMMTVEEMSRRFEEANRAEVSGSVYQSVAGIITESPFFSPGVLTETAPENYDTAQSTFYGINSNHRNQRQIAFIPSNRNVGMGYTRSIAATTADRNVKGAIWKNSNKLGGNFLAEIALNQDLIGRSGFCGMTYLPIGGRLVLYAHHATAPRGVYFGAENTAGLMDWGTDTEAPDSVAGLVAESVGIWPTAAGGYAIDVNDHDGDGSSTDSISVIHFFCNEGNVQGASLDRYFYGRGVDSAGVWIFPGFPNSVAAIVDTGTRVSPTVVASKKSPKVALIYTSENACNFNPPTCSDIYYVESTNGGNDWEAAGWNFGPIAEINITNYDSAATRRATGDLMGVYDNNDSLVIAYTEWTDWDDGSLLTDGVDIIVWTKAFGKRKAVVGNYEHEGEIPQGGFRYTLNFPMIGVHNGTGTPARTNFYYLTWTQFGGDAASDADTNIEGLLNGEVYISASTNGGKTWSSPVNATNSKTPACSLTGTNVGDCSGTIFSSCAEWVNDTIHIAYMSDQYAGVWTGGAASDDNDLAHATNNPMIYMKYPAFTPPPIVRAAVDQKTFFQNPGSALTDTFSVENIGNANLVVSSITKSQSWLTINNGSTGFTIPEGDPDVAIGFTVDDANPVALTDGVYYDTIRVHSNAAGADSNIAVAVFLIVDNGAAFVSPQWKTMDNGVVLVDVGNVGNVANQNDTGGFYRKVGGGSKIDTTNNLFDASKSIDVIGLDTLPYVARWIFNQNYMQPLDTVILKDSTVVATLPKKPGSKVKIPAGQYKYARVYYTAFYPGMNGIEWPGPWWGLKVCEEWWLPKTPNPAWDPKFLLWCQTIYFRQLPPSWWVTGPAFDTGSTVIYINKAMDWDVFTDDGNWAWANKAVGAAWQTGEIDTLVTDTMPNGHFGFVAYLDSLDNPSPYGVHIVSNPSYVYPNAGYVDAELYAIQADSSTDPATFVKPFTQGQFKYVPRDSLAKDTLPTDLNIVMTDLALSPPYPDSITVYNLLGVVGDTSHDPNKGCDSLANAYNAIRTALGLGTFANLDSLLNCKVSSCIAKPGDANASGNYTLGDVISIVNYVFNKDGCTPKPLCWLSNLLCRGDWNASGNVTLSDVIQAVNFVFNKPGGPWGARCVGVCCIPGCLP